MSTPKPSQSSRWTRYRFHSSSIDDPRPILWPPKGPYWVSGEGDNYAILIAYLPTGTDLLTYWPEATEIEGQERDSITFTERFPRPVWWWKGEDL